MNTINKRYCGYQISFSAADYPTADSQHCAIKEAIEGIRRFEKTLGLANLKKGGTILWENLKGKNTEEMCKVLKFLGLISSERAGNWIIFHNWKAFHSRLGKFVVTDPEVAFGLVGVRAYPGAKTMSFTKRKHAEGYAKACLAGSSGLELARMNPCSSIDKILSRK